MERLFRRCLIRRELGIRPLDIPDVYRRQIQVVATTRYNELLEPYLMTAFGSARWPDNVTLRRALASKLHSDAEAALHRDTGVAASVMRRPDIVKVIERLRPVDTIIFINGKKRSSGSTPTD
ncbi:hypothetical protein [Yoonia maricola]|uniref:hypothetical protein n=1 Tax=Yoonia maricola TaxID=420999 RepID=UPI001455CDA2|nr:hypothetical protein [Yoonia maricola]